jgi:outer membrane protein OmpA-like peptidoglycan-associated protein
VTKSKPSANLGLCILGICWLTGCTSTPPVQFEANSKPVEKQTPAPAVALSANSPSSMGANPEPTEREAREIHEEESIFFSLGSSTVSSKEKYKIDYLARRLLDDKNLIATLIGHANDNGSPSFNLAVADSRVMAVAEKLRKHGVQRSQIRKEAFGSELTPGSCRAAECRQRSRRVEFVFAKKR